MVQNRNALRAGVFIIGAAVLSLGIVITVTGPGLFEAKQRYNAVFSFDTDMQGIKKGDDVRLAGIRVGSVQEVIIADGQAPLPEAARALMGKRTATLPTTTQTADTANPPTRTAAVLVRLTIPKKYQLLEGATVSLNGGLIGGAVLNIDSLGEGLPLAEDGHIQGLPSNIARLFALAPRLEGIVTDLKTRTLPKAEAAIDEYKMLAADARAKTLPNAAAAADAARAAIEDVRSRITAIIDQYNKVTNAATTAATNIGDFIGPGNGPASGDFKQTMANVKDVTGTLKTELPQISEKIKRTLDQAEARITELRTTFSNLKETIDNTRDLTAAGRSILVDNRAKIDRIIASLESTASNAKNFSSEVLRRPSRLIWRDDEKTQGNLAVYHSARDFAEGAQELNDAVAQLRDLLKNPRSDPAEIQRRIDILNASFDRFGEVEGRLYKSIKP